MIDLSQQPWFADTEWLAVPDLVEKTGMSVSRVRRLFDEHALVGTRLGGPLRTPAVFLDDEGQPRGDLRGTITVLADNGFTDDEALDWIMSDDDSLGTSPIEALRAGRKAEVRRIAQGLL
ncbi:Rv2175c family DNA-binding protein [Frigoribacterium sp. Leaf263]|uniref:Rv2175c family DNA-binding protein n=1 Tax=unclassified Frigoribacterium TaxID=2627005 RepID=UPI000AA44654